jgi:hypothetical protein
VDESRRIDWVLGDVMRAHGPANCAPFAPPILPGMQSKAQPYQTYPPVSGTPSTGVSSTSVDITPPSPEPPAAKPAIGKGALLHSVFGPRTNPAANTTPAAQPMQGEQSTSPVIMPTSVRTPPTPAPLPELMTAAPMNAPAAPNNQANGRGIMVVPPVTNLNGNPQGSENLSWPTQR